ncbi:MAG: hypothetical protein ACKVOR_14075 [Flavobacteriales bacterium]
MKVFKIVHFLILFFLMVPIVQSQLHYYSGARVIDLTEDKKELIIYFNEGTNLFSITPTHSNMNSFQRDEWGQFIICHFNTDLPSNFEAATLGIAANTIHCQSFGFRLNDGFLLFLTADVKVEAKPNSANFLTVLEENAESFEGDFEYSTLRSILFR